MRILNFLPECQDHVSTESEERKRQIGLHLVVLILGILSRAKFFCGRYFVGANNDIFSMSEPPRFVIMGS